MMANKQNANKEFASLIDQVIQDSTADGAKERRPVDIITFCNHPNFLNLEKTRPLWPMQKVVLKMFYRGTRGNEHVQLTEQEIEMLQKISKEEDLDYVPEYGGFSQVIDKYRRWTLFRHLLLVMGRRSSKTFMVSIIASYEAYKLLETPDGNPHEFYKLPPGKPIAIVNVATSEDQAYNPLFMEIQARIAPSPYFSDKISPASARQVMYLLSDADKKENAARKARGMNIMIDGSVMLISGHSNSASIRGKAAICILFDEFGHMLNSSGKNSGDEVYNALAPSTQQFGADGKIVLLSDPKGRDGMFWKLFQMSQDRKDKDKEENKPTEWLFDDILALQLPTWCINPDPNFAKAKLIKEERPKDPLAFMSTWNARFLGESGSKFFDERRIEDSIDFKMDEAKGGDPRHAYFMHLDPATTSHNYALALVHVVTLMNKYQSVRRQVVVDMVKLWTPTEKGPVNLDELETYVRDVCRRFRVVAVTYDAFQSQQTIQRLKASGINAFETMFTATYKTTIYGELRNVLNQGDLVLYPNQKLVGEMKSLMYKIQQRTFKLFADPKSEYPTDDACDALAGAAYQALNYHVQQTLPRSGLVYFPRR
jgi:hypothetical protein